MHDAPIKGALVDLKNQPNVGSSNENADKGLLLPRVEIQKIDQLRMGQNSVNLTSQRVFKSGLSDALIKVDKHFEMFMFPDKDHSIVGAQTRNY